VGNYAAATSALANAQGVMRTNGDQYAVADATRALSVAVNDKATEAAALDAMISSGVPDAATLSVLYDKRATIAYEQGDRSAATTNARAALILGDQPAALQIIANLKREGVPAADASGTANFEPNALEFKRLANIVQQQNLDPEAIEKLVDEVRSN
jgi:inactivated superfamily I helicase